MDQCYLNLVTCKEAKKLYDLPKKSSPDQRSRWLDAIGATEEKTDEIAIRVCEHHFTASGWTRARSESISLSCRCHALRCTQCTIDLICLANNRHSYCCIESPSQDPFQTDFVPSVGLGRIIPVRWKPDKLLYERNRETADASKSFFIPFIPPYINYLLTCCATL